MKKKVLVCGSTGFIGKNIVERLSQKDGIEVYGTYFRSVPPDVPGVRYLKADLTNPVEVDRAVKGMDVIIQAAATTSGAKDIVTRPYYHVTDNAVMNSLIFRSAYESRAAHVVFFSCTVMYHSDDEPLKEADFDANREMHPRYFGVGWTKVYLEKMCRFYAGLGDTKFTAIRHSNVYGPHDKYDPERSHVFGATVAKVMSAPEGGDITVWGDGQEARDLLYISDLVDFVELAMEKQEARFELFNVGCGSATTVSQLVKKIIEHSGKALRIAYDPSKPSIKTALCLDSSKARNSIGWEPGTSLDEGIKKTLAWFKENIGAKCV